MVDCYTVKSKEKVGGNAWLGVEKNKKTRQFKTTHQR